MTDKCIRGLIEMRRIDWHYGSSVEAKYKAEECKDILELIDSLQEEPVSKQKLSNVERTIKDWKEPVSEDLEKAAVEAFKEIVDDERNSFLEIFKAGANWQLNKIRKEHEENRD